MEAILNIIGHPGAGKSRICQHLREQWGFEVYSPSRHIRDYAADRGVITDQLSLKEVRTEVDTIVRKLFNDSTNRTSIHLP